jgi:hypothetical protein
VLLGEWAAARGASWLTLSQRHCDARRRSGRDVLAALAARTESRSATSSARSGMLDEDFPLRLADVLAGAGARPVLVLDDLDQLRGPAFAALGELVLRGGGTCARGGGDALGPRAAARAPTAGGAPGASCARRTSRSPRGGGGPAVRSSASKLTRGADRAPARAD